MRDIDNFMNVSLPKVKISQHHKTSKTLINTTLTASLAHQLALFISFNLNLFGGNIKGNLIYPILELPQYGTHRHRNTKQQAIRQGI